MQVMTLLVAVVMVAPVIAVVITILLNLKLLTSFFAHPCTLRKLILHRPRPHPLSSVSSTPSATAAPICKSSPALAVSPEGQDHPARLEHPVATVATAWTAPLALLDRRYRLAFS